MTGHIGTPKFVPPCWGRPPFDPTQMGLCKFGWVWSSLKNTVRTCFQTWLLDTVKKHMVISGISRFLKRPLFQKTPFSNAEIVLDIPAAIFLFLDLPQPSPSRGKPFLAWKTYAFSHLSLAHPLQLSERRIEVRPPNSQSVSNRRSLFRALWNVSRTLREISCCHFPLKFEDRNREKKTRTKIAKESSRTKLERGEKTPTPKISALLRKRPILLRANFVLTKDQKRPYYGHFCCKIHTEESRSQAAGCP